MKNLTKRNLLKLFGFGIGGFFASTAFGKIFSTPKKAQLIYRIDFPTELSKIEHQRISHTFFNKALHKELLKEIGCTGALQKKFDIGPKHIQKVVTFPSAEQLNAYVQKIKERKNIVNHNAMIDNGYKVSFKILT